MKVARIVIIILLLLAIAWYLAYAEAWARMSSARRFQRYNSSPRQIYNNNRAMDEVHTTRPYRPHEKRKTIKKTIIRCIDSKTGKPVSCPEIEPKEED